MTDFMIKIADMTVGVHALYGATKEFCRGYLTDGEPLFEVTVTAGDIERERLAASEADIMEEHPQAMYPDEYLETLALCRMIAEHSAAYGALLFHGAAAAAGGRAFLFAAPSGTGKTTHVKLWERVYEDCHILNGDKPFLLFRRDGIYVCGSPWQGKENYGRNETLELGAVCLLERSSKNHIEEISLHDALPALTGQVYIPEDSEMRIAALKLMGSFAGTRLYRLGCSMNDDAARIAREAMSRKMMPPALPGKP